MSSVLFLFVCSLFCLFLSLVVFSIRVFILSRFFGGFLRGYSSRFRDS